MNSKDKHKSELLQRMHDILDQRKTSNEQNFSRKCRLRDNLISFGEEFLTPVAFDRLVWILKDGGVDLLPMPQIKKPCRKRNRNSDDDYEPPTPRVKQQRDSEGKRTSIIDSSMFRKGEEEEEDYEPPSGEADKYSIHQNWMRRKLESIAKQFSAFDSRLQKLEMSAPVKDLLPESPIEEVQPPDYGSPAPDNSESDHEPPNEPNPDPVPRTKLVYKETEAHMNWDSYRKIDLPFRDNIQFEEINKMAEDNQNFYRLVVTQFRQIYDDYFRKGGWRLVFDGIFDQEFVKYYHYMGKHMSDKDFVSREGYVKKPLHRKILIRKGLNDAFPEHEPIEFTKEFKQWIMRKKENFAMRKFRKIGGRPNFKYYTFIDDPEPVVIPKETLTRIEFPIDSEVHFEHVNRDVQHSPQLYDQFEHECRKIYEQKIQNGGWREIFDCILGRNIVKWYHFMNHETRAIKNEDGEVRRSIHGKFIIRQLLSEIFTRVDLDVLLKEFKAWFKLRRHTYTAAKWVERKGMEDESRDSSTKSSSRIEKGPPAKKSFVAKKSTSKPKAKKRGRPRKRPETEEETTSDEDEDEPLASFSSTKRLRNSAEGERISHEDILELVAAVEVEDIKDFIFHEV